MNTAWTISAGVTWFPSTAFVTTSSTDSSAASPAPARGHRAPTPLSLWLRASEGNSATDALWERLLPAHRTVLIARVFSSWSTWLMNFVKRSKREKPWTPFVKEGNAAADAHLPKRSSHHFIDHIGTGKTLQITEHLKTRWCNIYVVISLSVFLLKPLKLQAIKRTGKDNSVFSLLVCCIFKGVWFHTPLFKLLWFRNIWFYILSGVQWICDMLFLCLDIP